MHRWKLKVGGGGERERERERVTGRTIIVASKLYNYLLTQSHLLAYIFYLLMTSYLYIYILMYQLGCFASVWCVAPPLLGLLRHFVVCARLASRRFAPAYYPTRLRRFAPA